MWRARTPTVCMPDFCRVSFPSWRRDAEFALPGRRLPYSCPHRRGWRVLWRVWRQRGYHPNYGVYADCRQRPTVDPGRLRPADDERSLRSPGPRGTRPDCYPYRVPTSATDAVAAHRWTCDPAHCAGLSFDPAVDPVSTIRSETPAPLSGPTPTTLIAPQTAPTLPSTQDLTQRTRVFYIVVHIGDKTAKLIVDSRSCVNAVSREATKRLGLATTPHPIPYKVSWINGTALSVTHQCEVPLKMSTYAETVLCDVVPMKIGSLILGQPWLFDHDAALAGRANTCLFLFDGRRILWHPSPTPLATRVPPKPTSPLAVTNGCIFAW